MGHVWRDEWNKKKIPDQNHTAHENPFLAVYMCKKMYMGGELWNVLWRQNNFGPNLEKLRQICM